MKTSTKNVIITGIFTLIAGLGGCFAERSIQNNKIENTVVQSGIITINENESALETVDRLLNEYFKIQTEVSDLRVTNENLNNKIKNLEMSLKSEKTNFESDIFSDTNSNTDPEVKSEKALFDDDPYMKEGILLYMRNNDKSTVFNNGYVYDTGFRMVSNGVEYQKGMAVTPNSSKQASLYYNLGEEYSFLSGKAAFEDKYSERADKKYSLYFYGDNELIDSFTIVKGELPIKFNINVSGCSILRIMLERPEGDKSKNPNLNLIEFMLYN